MKFVFILNGRQDKTEAMDAIKKRLQSMPDAPEYELYETKGPGDATGFVKDYCEAKPEEEVCFVACGGDGTVKEVASGIVSKENKYFAVLAFGTGNDFVKYWPEKGFRSLSSLFNGTKEQIDIIKIGDNYSINVCNFGFDSVVGSTGARLSAKGWKNPYRWGIVVAILKGRFNNIVVKADGEQLNSKKLLLCTLANNHYVGGEFFCAPRAKNNDGLIDVCVLKTMSLMSFLKILPVYTAGKHLDDPAFASKIAYKQAKKVEVSAPKPIEICLDGEMVATQNFTAEILPGAVGMIIPQ